MPQAGDGFRHEALLYEGEEGFLAGVTPFVARAIDAGVTVLAVLDRAKHAPLQQAVAASGADTGRLTLADMAAVGANPARIIPAWHDFVASHAATGTPIAGVGEPIWAGRRPAELAECHVHEALLNVVFGEGPAWPLLCPYDVSTLPASVLDHARRNHAVVSDERSSAAGAWPGTDEVWALLAQPLPEPLVATRTVPFGPDDLDAVRRAVGTLAQRSGLSRDRADDLVLVANEVATNSIRHAGGGGHMRLWSDDEAVVCEIRDRGWVRDPLVGRFRPDLHRPGGRGFWLANQLCDLVQLRTGDTGTVVRLHMWRGDADVSG